MPKQEEALKPFGQHQGAAGGFQPCQIQSGRMLGGNQLAGAGVAGPLGLKGWSGLERAVAAGEGEPGGLILDEGGGGGEWAELA